jgi:hypothetical protein
MKINKSAILIIGSVATILTSCYWKNWDKINTVSGGSGGGSTSGTTCSVPADSILYNGTKVFRPDTVVGINTIMSYSIDIAPIISSNCATNSSCHGSGATVGKDYTIFSNLYSDCKHDTTGSTLFQYISGTGVGVGDQMPKGGAPLSTCLHNKIRNWIHQGAQSN